VAKFVAQPAHNRIHDVATDFLAVAPNLLEERRACYRSALALLEALQNAKF